jgi:hypothetical protein
VSYRINDERFCLIHNFTMQNVCSALQYLESVVFYNLIAFHVHLLAYDRVYNAMVTVTARTAAMKPTAVCVHRILFLLETATVQIV